MRARTATWFETRIQYEKMMENGENDQQKELYVVDALSYAEAEEKILEEMSAYVSGAIEVLDIKRPSYKEIFFSELVSADKWYKAKLQFITLDEKTEKEKRKNVYYLVQATTFFEAVKNIDEVMGKTMIDYEIVSVTKTQIKDVFEHHAKTHGEERNDVPEYEEQQA